MAPTYPVTRWTVNQEMTEVLRTRVIFRKPKNGAPQNQVIHDRLTLAAGTTIGHLDGFDPKWVAEQEAAGVLTPCEWETHDPAREAAILDDVVVEHDASTRRGARSLTSSGGRK